MKLGTKETTALRLGAAAVLKAYLGGSQVWPLGFDPASLFAQGEQGVWYDPSDFSTLFQDSAGTTPVTAVEQPVGLMLDKSKGLVLGQELVITPYSGTATGGFSSTGDSLVRNGGDSRFSLTINSPVIIGRFYKVTFNVSGFSGDDLIVRIGDISGAFSRLSGNGQKSLIISAIGGSSILYFAGVSTNIGTATITNISVRELPGNHATQATTTSRPVLSARVNQYLATETLATQNVTTLAAQYRLNFEGTGTITLSGTATGVYSAGSHLITCTAGTLTSTVSGSVTKADLRVANTGANLPPYQRVNTATDYDTVGFPHYLRFDGVDDWLVTPTITPGIDKAQVFAGVRKIGTTSSIVAELSAATETSDGSFYFTANEGGPGRNSWALRGSQLTRALTNQRQFPSTEVVACLYDISKNTRGEETIPRINGNDDPIVSGTGLNAGTGSFLAYPLYIGRRGGTMLPFNGHLYGLIVRFGSNLPIETIEKTEKYINTKTGAY